MFSEIKRVFFTYPSQSDFEGYQTITVWHFVQYYIDAKISNIGLSIVTF